MSLFSNLIHDDFARFLTAAADEKIAFLVCRAICVLGSWLALRLVCYRKREIQHMQSIQLLQLKWVEFQLYISSLRTATEDVLMEPHRMVFVHEGVRGALNEVGLEVVLKRSRSRKNGQNWRKGSI